MHLIIFIQLVRTVNQNAMKGARECCQAPWGPLTSWRHKPDTRQPNSAAAQIPYAGCAPWGPFPLHPTNLLSQAGPQGVVGTLRTL